MGGDTMSVVKIGLSIGGHKVKLSPGDFITVELDRDITLRATDQLKLYYGGLPTPPPPQPWIVKRAWNLVKYWRSLGDIGQYFVCMVCFVIFMITTRLFIEWLLG
jgi:hypothetical protein